MPTRTEIRTVAPAIHAPAHRPQPDRWRCAGVEPALGDLLNDPLTALVMRRDGIGRDDVMAAVAEARRRLSRQRHPAVALDGRQGGATIRALRLVGTPVSEHHQAAC